MRFLLLGLALLCAAEDKDYYPTKAGMEWTYVWEDKKEDIVTVEGPKTFDDLEVVVFKFDVQDHASTRNEYYGVADEGVVYYGASYEEDEWADDTRENPRMVLKFGSKKGDKWEWKMDDEHVFTYENQGEEDVEVPAGKYKAIKIANSGTLAGSKNVTTEWYAKDVGLVKRVSDTEGSKTVMVLKKVK